jgi:DNA-binding CsgD family transcriptional regulator
VIPRCHRPRPYERFVKRTPGARKRDFGAERGNAAPAVGGRAGSEGAADVPGLLGAALDAALEALPAAAFVLGPHGSVEVANRAGAALLECDREGVLESIRESERGGNSAGAYSIVPLAVTCSPSCLLAVRKETDPITARVRMAQTTWSLTLRQARVFELLVAGNSNKEIAGKLACAEITVESHITELFRRSGARSRAGLVGLLLSFP